jgi:hypothetical protein
MENWNDRSIKSGEVMRFICCLTARAVFMLLADPCRR